MKSSILLLILILLTSPVWAQGKNNADEADTSSNSVFDDEALLDGYAQKYDDESQDILLAMAADDSLGAYKCTAAVKDFKEKYANDVLSKEKTAIIKTLIRRLNRTDSPFLQIEIMDTLVVLDRFQYFESMVPALIQKMDHYNPVVSNTAYKYVFQLTQNSLYPREARIVFETIRKMLFLSRNHLASVTTPDENLQHKLFLLRWSITILGTSELKRLPPEVINLL